MKFNPYFTLFSWLFSTFFLYLFYLFFTPITFSSRHSRPFLRLSHVDIPQSAQANSFHTRALSFIIQLTVLNPALANGPRGSTMSAGTAETYILPTSILQQTIILLGTISPPPKRVCEPRIMVKQLVPTYLKEEEIDLTG
jgi:hypothetical protein